MMTAPSISCPGAVLIFARFGLERRPRCYGELLGPSGKVRREPPEGRLAERYWTARQRWARHHGRRWWIVFVSFAAADQATIGRQVIHNAELGGAADLGLGRVMDCGRNHKGELPWEKARALALAVPLAALLWPWPLDAASLVLRATAPRTNNAGTCRAPIEVTAADSMVWIHFEFVPGALHDSVRVQRGQTVVKFFDLPAGGYIVRAYVVRYGFTRVRGCDVLLWVDLEEPGGLPVIER